MTRWLGLSVLGRYFDSICFSLFSGVVCCFLVSVSMEENLAKLNLDDEENEAFEEDVGVIERER